MASASSQMAPATSEKASSKLPELPKITTTVSTVSGKAPTQYPNALEYLRDVKELPYLIRVMAKHEPEMAHRIPQALRDAPVKRGLEFKGWKTKNVRYNPADFTHFNTSRWVHNIKALLIYISGVEMEDKCQDGECDKIFAFCVIPDPAFDYDGKLDTAQACANHHYDIEGSKCAFRKAYLAVMKKQKEEEAVAEAVAEAVEKAVEEVVAELAAAELAAGNKRKPADEDSGASASKRPRVEDEESMFVEQDDDADAMDMA